MSPGMSCSNGADHIHRPRNVCVREQRHRNLVLGVVIPTVTWYGYFNQLQFHHLYHEIECFSILECFIRTINDHFLTLNDRGVMNLIFQDQKWLDLVMQSMDLQPENCSWNFTVSGEHFWSDPSTFGALLGSDYELSTCPIKLWWTLSLSSGKIRR